jgi:hypothetical protein
MYSLKRKYGHSSCYEPTDTSNIDENDIEVMDFMFKLNAYVKIDGILERYASTLRILICGIDENRMTVRKPMYDQYVTVLHDIHLIMQLYNQHRMYINHFIGMYEKHGVLLHGTEGRALFDKYRGGMAFVQLDDVMQSLRLI